MELQHLNYKEPLTKVEDGHGYYGTLSQTKNGELVQCHICSELVENLGTHVWVKHNVRAVEYREKFKLGKRTPLCSDKFGEKLKHMAVIRYNRLTETEKAERRQKMIEAQKKAVRVGNPTSLQIQNKRGMCPDQLIEKIQLLADKLGESPTHKQFIREYNGKYVGAINRTFGSWNAAKHMAGFAPRQSGSKVPHNRAPYTNEQLLEFLRSAYKEKGSAPTYSDWRKGFLPSYYLYKHRFGGISKARKAAGITA